MKNVKYRVVCPLQIGLTLMLLAGAASAQGRPTLKALTDAICRKADVEEADYRPAVCDARCDCLEGTDLSTLTACEEAGSGQFVAGNTLSNLGTCGVAPVCTPPAGCSGSSYDPCSGSGGPCSGAAEACLETSPGSGSFFCMEPCATDQDCSQPDPMCSLSSLVTCQTSNDCSPPESCGVLTKRCGVGCIDDLTCIIPAGLSVWLTGVDANDPIAPAECTVNAADPISINSKDAEACRASIEAVTGPCQ